MIFQRMKLTLIPKKKKIFIQNELPIIDDKMTNRMQKIYSTKKNSGKKI